VTPNPRRRLAGQIAANTRWAHEPDRRAATAPGTAAFLDRFEREVDPEGKLDPVERGKRAANARSAYFQRLRLAGIKARAARKAADDGAA
jgi:hypothetical protein